CTPGFDFISAPKRRVTPATCAPATTAAERITKLRRVREDFIDRSCAPRVYRTLREARVAGNQTSSPSTTKLRKAHIARSPAGTQENSPGWTETQWRGTLGTQNATCRSPV